MFNKVSTNFLLSRTKAVVLFFLCLLTKISAEEPLSVGFWNVENLFDLENHPDKNDDEFALGGRKNVTKEIYKKKIKHTAEVLDDLMWTFLDCVRLKMRESSLILIMHIPNETIKLCTMNPQMSVESIMPYFMIQTNFSFHQAGQL